MNSAEDLIDSVGGSINRIVAKAFVNQLEGWRKNGVPRTELELREKSTKVSALYYL